MSDLHFATAIALDCAGHIDDRPQIEMIRDKLYYTLEDYCRQTFANEPTRFARLLLRLAPLRQVKCIETVRAAQVHRGAVSHATIGDHPVRALVRLRSQLRLVGRSAARG